MKILKKYILAPIIILLYSIKARRVLNKEKRKPGSFTEMEQYGVTRDFGEALINLAGYKVSVKNQKGFKDLKNTVIVTNHSSIFEPMVVSLVIPDVLKWISKRKLHDSFILGPLSKTGQAFSIDRKNPSSASITLFKAARAFKKGYPLALCPEGTRAPTEEMLPFKTDVFKFFKTIKADILPIKVNYRLNQKNPDGTPNFNMEVNVLEKIKFQDYKNLEPEKITEAVFNVMSSN